MNHSYVVVSEKVDKESKGLKYINTSRHQCLHCSEHVLVFRFCSLPGSEFKDVRHAHCTKLIRYGGERWQNVGYGCKPRSDEAFCHLGSRKIFT